MDLGTVAHLAAIEGRVPFINFFDGFRTSHEIQKINVWDYKDLKDMVDMDAVKAFSESALNPEHPTMRGSARKRRYLLPAQEACNKYYDAVPAIVEKYMDKINEKIGTDYKLFNYYGAPDAEKVIVAMGSVCDVAEEVIDYLTAKGEKGRSCKGSSLQTLQSGQFVEAIPATVKKIAVLDRTKEPGALGEPLFLDTVAALDEMGRTGLKVSGGRYGLGSKDTYPASIFAVYEHLKEETPARRSQSASTMMSLTFHFPKSRLPLPRQRVLSSASSGVSAATVQSVQTKTLSRSSVTIQISMFRHISSMTQRRPAVLQFLTFASATSPLRAHTI